MNNKTKNLNSLPLKNNKKIEQKQLEEIADKILTKYKYAFEVLGNANI